MRVNTIRQHFSSGFNLSIDNLIIKENTVTGLIGKNGAGKTSLMNILSGFVEASGDCRIEIPSSYKVLYISSDLMPFEFMRVEEFCDLVLKHSRSSVSSRELIEKMGLRAQADQMIDTLSMGMKKKLTLINLFIETYDLVIMDEPFNSIDIHFIRDLKQTINDMKVQSSFLISSHIIDTLIDICDEFILLDEGKIKKRFDNSVEKEELEKMIFDEII